MTIFATIKALIQDIATCPVQDDTQPMLLYIICAIGVKVPQITRCIYSKGYAKSLNYNPVDEVVQFDEPNISPFTQNNKTCNDLCHVHNNIRGPSDVRCTPEHSNQLKVGTYTMK